MSDPEFGADTELPAVARQVSESVDRLTASNRVLVARIDRLTGRSVRQWAAIAGVAVALVGVTVVGWRSATVQACQEGLNGEFRAAIVQRQDVATAERGAQRRLLDVVLDPVATPQDRAEATRSYYAGLLATDTARDLNPLPTGDCS
ncbi:MAG: hypothetical protein ACRDTZ_00370 [Pseudonocardiaceae bacterium]